MTSVRQLTTVSHLEVAGHLDSSSSYDGMVQGTWFGLHLKNGFAKIIANDHPLQTVIRSLNIKAAIGQAERATRGAINTEVKILKVIPFGSAINSFISSI